MFLSSLKKKIEQKGAKSVDNAIDFERVKEEFSNADIDRKVQIYVSAEGFTQEQYKDLLTMFPSDQLSLLEQALQ